MDTKSSGQSGQQTITALKGTVTRLLQAPRLDGQQVQNLSTALWTARDEVVRASSMSEDDMRRKGDHHTIQSAQGQWITDDVREPASQILHALDNKADANNTRFHQACQTAIGQLYPLFDQFDLQTPAEATAAVQAYAGSQSGQSGSGQPGRSDKPGRPDTW